MDCFFFKIIQELQVVNAVNSASEAKHWVESFVSVYRANDVTPYMDAFANMCQNSWHCMVMWWHLLSRD